MVLNKWVFVCLFVKLLLSSLVVKDDVLEFIIDNKGRTLSILFHVIIKRTFSVRALTRKENLFVEWVFQDATTYFWFRSVWMKKLSEFIIIELIELLRWVQYQFFLILFKLLHNSILSECRYFATKEQLIDNFVHSTTQLCKKPSVVSYKVMIHKNLQYYDCLILHALLKLEFSPGFRTFGK